MTSDRLNTFFVVDVETSGVNPCQDVVFSLGCVAVTYDERVATIEANYFYEAIDQTEWIQASDWFSTVMDQQSTLSWWLRQPIDVQKAAWRAEGVRFREREVASMFCDFVAGMTAGTESKPIFAASPASFDKPFIDQMLRNSGEKDPFDYRSLCIRSMAYGFGLATPWGVNGWQNRSQVPHHALYDAYGAALDLVMLLSERDEVDGEDELRLIYSGSNDE